MSNIHSDFKSLTQAPHIAWPTVILFASAWIIYISSIIAAEHHILPISAVVVINAIMTFWLFTVFHDAGHHSVSRNKRLNDWLGRISIFAFSPLPIFRAFRFIHMQHHRFANEDGDKDPDAWCGEGPWWSLPFRWATLDLKYYVWYLPKLRSRPRSEQMEVFFFIIIGLSTVSALLYLGYGYQVFWYWFLPSRIAIMFLALAFDFLPHYPYKVPESVDKYQATSNRIGLEWLLSPIFLYQNYHLVHHLYPLVPFYRYIKVWRAKEEFHLAQNPLLVGILNQELTPSEYKAKRGI